MSDSGSPSERLSSSLVPTDSGPRASIFQVEEILRLIVEELGERTGKNMSYRNKKSLASLVATCKSFEGSLQTFLYVQDFKDREMRGMRYAITRCQDHIAIGVLNKYPENLLKTCVNARFGFGGGPTGHCHLTMLHLAAFRDMYDTIGKLHELGAKWLYAKNFQAALSSGFRGTLSSFPALQSVLNDIEWAPNFACLVKTDRDRHTCELLAKYWPESYPFVGKFTYPPALLPGRPRDEEYRMTLLHLSLLLAPGRDTVKMMDWTLEQYPELKQLPGTEHECSIQHIAVKAQNEAVVRRLVVECDIGPYFVDNRGYNPLHVAVELVLQGGDSLRPRGQSGATKILNLIIDRRSTNPMMPQTMAPYQTPLLMVASYVFIDWSGRNSVIKKCIDLVVKCEKGYADARGFGRVVYTMNRSDSNGNTVLGYITKAIVNYHVESGSKPLEDLFSKMITEYNADINLDVNKFPSPTNRPYVHSIKWMADHASGRSRFKKLVNDLGGHLHHAEVLGIAAPTDASAGFPPDQLHALHLPLNHPYALPQSLNSLRTFSIELANLQASLQRGRPGMIYMAMQMFGKSQSEAEEEFSRIVEQRTQMFIRRCGSEARQSSEHLREGPGS